MKTKMTDKEFESMKRLIDSTIHELVFACHYAEDDEIESAQNALMTAQGNLERVAEDLLKHDDAA